MKKSLLVVACLIATSNFIFSQCGNSEQYGYVGWFDDGSGDGNYLDNQSCSWQFESATGAPIRLGFYDFNTEANYDYIRIYDGTSEGSPLIAEYSGTPDVSVIITCSGPYAFVTFTSDVSYGYPGFSGWWDVNTPVLACVGYPHSGYNPYPDNVNQGILIAPTAADKITFGFSAFELELNYDFVYLYDGYDSGAPLIGSYTGSTLPGSVTTTGGALYILFTTDGSYGYAGFSGYYQCSTCSDLTNLSDCTGSFGDGSEAVNYSEYSNCSWLVNVDGAVNLTFDFTNMDTESCCDFVQIYDGPDANFPLLSNVSGSTLQTGIVTSSGIAFVKFVTDGSISGTGWGLNYSCSTVGVEEEGFNSVADMSAYPNPADNELQVIIPSNFKQSIVLTAYNSLGAMAMKKQVKVSGNNRAVNLSVADLPAATYMFFATDGEKRAQQRVVIN